MDRDRPGATAWRARQDRAGAVPGWPGGGRGFDAAGPGTARRAGPGLVTRRNLFESGPPGRDRGHSSAAPAAEPGEETVSAR